ncbi:unnamed protein product [Pleuronectes platessa]|uniref:Secreted protein n=1 Tax=Pleuronectes platessa TaxID=8262 RepID=A0A9N7W544_PLEPL|nr:unnamed protein product [Pleuronectes platessa]
MNIQVLFLLISSSRTVGKQDGLGFCSHARSTDWPPRTLALYRCGWGVFWRQRWRADHPCFGPGSPNTVETLPCGRCKPSDRTGAF